MNWLAFKKLCEREFKFLELEEGIYGFQIQPGTRWNKGLSEKQIIQLEQQFGFIFPIEYRAFLKVMNGFDHKCISIDPDGQEENRYCHLCYTYPKNCYEQDSHYSYLLKDLADYKASVFEVLIANGFNIAEFQGFVPLYSHRALVVFKDKLLSPVISIMQDDIVVIAQDLKSYWIKQFNLEQFFTAN